MEVTEFHIYVVSVESKQVYKTVFSLISYKITGRLQDFFFSFLLEHQQIKKIFRQKLMKFINNTKFPTANQFILPN